MGKPRLGERRPNLTRCHRWPSISRSGREIGLLYVSTHWSPRVLLTPFCARSQRGGRGGHSTLKHVPHSFALMLHVNLLQTETSCQYHITLCGRRILPFFRHLPSRSSTECICNYKIDNSSSKTGFCTACIPFRSPANFLCCCKQSRDSSTSLRENSTFQIDNRKAIFKQLEYRKSM